MNTLDRASEARRLKEVYAEMSDEQLVLIAEEAYQLTDVAKQAFVAEVGARKLDVEVRTEAPVDEEREEERDDRPASENPWAEVEQDEEGPLEFDPDHLSLTVACKVWGKEDAITAKTILDEAGIPSYLGADNVEKVEDFQGDFDRGVNLKVRDVDRDWAKNAIRDRWPEPSEAEQAEMAAAKDAEFAVRCPKCHSTEVVLQGSESEMEEDDESDGKYEWSCDGCGHRWSDEGVAERIG